MLGSNTYGPQSNMTQTPQNIRQTGANQYTTSFNDGSNIFSGTTHMRTENSPVQKNNKQIRSKQLMNSEERVNFNKDFVEKMQRENQNQKMGSQQLQEIKQRFDPS